MNQIILYDISYIIFLFVPEEPLQTLGSLLIQYRDLIKWKCDMKWEFFFDKNGPTRDLLSG